VREGLKFRGAIRLLWNQPKGGMEVISAGDETRLKIHEREENEDGARIPRWGEKSLHFWILLERAESVKSLTRIHW
jgi:hypothetical protein